MRKPLISVLTILWISSFFFVCAWAKNTKKTVVQVQDRSGPGNPFAISGTVELRETPLENERVRVEISENILAKNISGKTILTFVAWLDLTPAYGGPEHSVRQYECFFAPDVIKPGEDHTLSQPRPGYSIDPYDPADSPQPARAELRIVYVQFLDGSVFGQETLGRHIRSLRKQTWHHLKDLDKTYTKLGEADFLQELSETVEPGEVDVFIENIRQTQRTSGTVAAVLKIQSALEFARERQAGFDSSLDD
jgi:hypothetical protein